MRSFPKDRAGKEDRHGFYQTDGVVEDVSVDKVDAVAIFIVISSHGRNEPTRNREGILTRVVDWYSFGVVVVFVVPMKRNSTVPPVINRYGAWATGNVARVSIGLLYAIYLNRTLAPPDEREGVTMEWSWYELCERS